MEIYPFDTHTRGLTLRGSLYLPQSGSAPYPTAVLFHGFGGTRVDVSGFLVQIAKGLTEAGIAVVTYDRAGHGESDGEFFDTSVSVDVRDGLEVVRAVARDERVDEGSLHLGGLSLGAVIASVVAAESEIPVRSLTMCSTAAVFVDEIASGSIQGMPLDSLNTVGYFDFIGMKMGPAMVEDAKTFDVYGRASGYRGPVTLIHGTEDFVPVSYAQRYADMWGERAHLVIVEGANHGFMTVPHRELVVRTTVDFVAKECGAHD